MRRGYSHFEETKNKETETDYFRRNHRPLFAFGVDTCHQIHELEMSWRNKLELQADSSRGIWPRNWRQALHHFPMSSCTILLLSAVYSNCSFLSLRWRLYFLYLKITDLSDNHYNLKATILYINMKGGLG